ncbi:KCTD2 isoform 6 [Pongo abelii]|uniref:KCTD2 isoform 6 n=1 Tax=Pongo abelii TaxID=9601 RepID=A0A2J8Y0C3_PONAB|nr:KCTD2 isoform 6 [Pongo abelii]
MAELQLDPAMAGLGGGAGSRTTRADRGRRRGPLGQTERGRHLLRDHQTDLRPGAQVIPLPPLLPGGPGAGLRQG